jgi:NDP-sugar pyrophosphorylase family protein
MLPGTAFHSSNTPTEGVYVEFKPVGAVAGSHICADKLRLMVPAANNSEKNFCISISLVCSFDFHRFLKTHSKSKYYFSLTAMTCTHHFGLARSFPALSRDYNPVWLKSDGYYLIYI